MVMVLCYTKFYNFYCDVHFIIKFCYTKTPKIKSVVYYSRLYNGDKNELTTCAAKLFECATQRISELESTLMKLEKAINPLLDDNDIVAFR